MPENAHTVTTRKAWMRRLTSIFGLALVLMTSLLAAHDMTFRRGASISRPSLDHSSLSVKTESLYAYDRLIRPSPDRPGLLAIYHYDGPGFAPQQTPSSPFPT